jgi:hypothetical protein
MAAGAGAAMMVPTIHLNGTSRQELLDGYVVTLRAVCDAIDALSKAHPNGRDYYVQGPDATHKAKDEHRSRVHRLASVRDELAAIAEAIHDQGGGR